MPLCWRASCRFKQLRKFDPGPKIRCGEAAGATGIFRLRVVLHHRTHRQMLTNTMNNIPEHLVIHIAEIVEQNGGIEAFNPDRARLLLPTLLDPFPDEFGKRGTKLRRLATNKVYKWTQYSREDYLDSVLNKYKILSYNQRKSQTRQPRSILSCSRKRKQESSSEEHSPQISPPQTEQESSSEEHSPQTLSPPQTRTMGSLARLTSKQLPENTQEVDFNENNPECHSNIDAVLASTNIHGTDNITIYDGYEIWVEINYK